MNDSETSPTGDAPTPESPQDVAAGDRLTGQTSQAPSVVGSVAVSSTAGLNPRSCVTCRKRKVKCSKEMPICSNCRRNQCPCIYPAPGRAPRRPRPKDPNAPAKQSSEREIELMKRLRKLEGIVEDLSGQIELDNVRNHSSPGNSPSAANDEHVEHAGNMAGATPVGPSAVNCSPYTPLATNKQVRTNRQFDPTSEPLRRSSAEINKTFGRLVLHDHGRSRYVSSGFWSRINDELDKLRVETQMLTDEDEDAASENDQGLSPEEQRDISDHHVFIFGYSSTAVDLRPLHLLPSQIPFIWQVYQENVDPLIKVLHVPSVNKMFKEMRADINSLSPSMEALVFSIYYAAITSMEEDEVLITFGTEKSKLLGQFRFAVEQSFAKADFLTSTDLVVLQAFVIFLVLVRRHDTSRFAWTLTGLVMRMSQSLGLHRDGVNFPKLTPYEIEMRRRLFWAICILDLRSAEDQGTDLTIIDRSFDTQMPLNINDADISPESTLLPPPRQEATELTFSLIRYEICGLARRLHAATSAMALICPNDAGSSLEDRERLIAGIYGRVEAKYLRYCSPENAMHWVAGIIARLIVAKMTLIVYEQVMFTAEQDLPAEIRDRLFLSAIEIVEYSHILNNDFRCRQWRWLFQTYTQWHAVAYILMEITRRPWSATVERAWFALGASEIDPKLTERQKDQIVVWLPLKRLYMKARKHRDGEIKRLREDPFAAQQLDLDDRARAPHARIASAWSTDASSRMRERWRSLVGNPPVIDETPKPTPASIPPSEPANTTPTPQLMDIMDAAMSQPTFSASDFWPVLYENNAQPVQRHQGVFGFTGDLPQQDAQLVGAGEGVATGHLSVPPLATSATTPAVNGDNPPPWMWSHPYDTGNRYGNAKPEDIDIDMGLEDDFNWQNWTETMKGLGMETGTGVTGGAWSQGI